jgi:hypothetical protein
VLKLLVSDPRADAPGSARKALRAIRIVRAKTGAKPKPQFR